MVSADDLLTQSSLDATKIAAEITSVSMSLDVAFILLSGYLVFFMQTGFAMLTAGSVRSKNTKNVLMKNILDACVGSIAYYVFGWAFAYGPAGNRFIGLGNFALSSQDGVAFNQYHLFYFQWAFAATSTTIVSGSVAERTSLYAYLGYAWYITCFV
jgi:ammonium transporter, Amt family